MAKPVRKTHPTAPLYFGGVMPVGSISVDAVVQHQAELSLLFTQLTDQIADSQVPVSAVVQHEASLSLAFAQLVDQIANAQVPASAVVQHQAALSIAWSQLTGVPTTLAGFGITDAYTKTASDARYPLLAGPFAWSGVTGAPTTLAGYGITDAYTKTAADVLLAAKAPLASPALTGTPTAPTPTAADNTTKLATTAFVTAALAAYTGPASYPWSSITGKPTTLAGYGITDAYTKTASDARYALIATTLSGYGITDAYTKTASDARFAPIAGPFPWADVTGAPTTLAGYGITDAYTKTAADSLLAAKAPLASPTLTGTPTAPTPAAADNTTKLATTAFVTAALAAYAGPSSFPWSSITGTPTTLAGYGIADGLSQALGDARYLQLTGGTVSGYVIGTTGVRAMGVTAYPSGSGAEVQYTGGNANFLGYDRTGGVYLPTRILGSTVSLLVGGTSNGLTLNSSGNIAMTGMVTASGGLTVNQGASTTALIMDGTGLRDISWRYNGTQVWVTRVTASTGTADGGSDFQLLARTDANAGIDTPFEITRAAGGSITMRRNVYLTGAGSSATAAAMLRFRDNNSGSSRDFAISNGWGIGAAAIGALVFSESTAANGDPLSGNELMRLDANALRLTGVNIAIGPSVTAGTGLYINGQPWTTSNANEFGIACNPAFDTSATIAGHGLSVATSTKAATWTLPLLYSIKVSDVTKGAGSSVTTQYGLYMNNLTGAATNYAIYTNTGDVSFGDTVTIRAGGLAVNAGGIAVTGASTITGALSGLTALSMGGNLTMTQAASQIIPGATAFGVRNNANSEYNLFLQDNGLATFRNSVTAPAYRSNAGIASCANGVATSLGGLPDIAGLWLVVAYVSGQAATAGTAYGIVAATGNTSWKMMTTTGGTNLTLSLSGGSLQATQTFGTTQTVNIIYAQIS